MAVTATIVLSVNGSKEGQRHRATVTVSNSGGSDVAVQHIEMYAYQDEDSSVRTRVPCLVGSFDTNNGQKSTVASGGSTAFLSQFVPMWHAAEDGLTMFQKAKVTVRIEMTDGTVVSPTADAILYVTSNPNRSQLALQSFGYAEKSAYPAALLL